MTFTIFMQQIAESDSRVGIGHIVSILHGAVDGGFYLVAWTGGAVVVEEVIAIYAVFGPVVFLKQVEEVFFFSLGEVQCLLPDVPSQVVVFGGEMLVIGYAQLIVRLSQGEAEDEVGGVEIEHTVVEDGVNAPGEVFVTDGGVAEQGIDFPARGAGQQADADGVGGSFLRRLWLGGGRGRAEEAEEEIYENE